MILQSPFIFFTDAVLRAPTIGCMLMCFAAALVGVIVLLKKQSLVGESLSHAAYPGVVTGVFIAGLMGVQENDQTLIAMLIMVFAFMSALLGLYMIHFLIRKMKIQSDSALCFILSSFFGIGLTIASQLQFQHASLYRQIQAYLYGQAATMTDVHIWIYGLFSLIILVVITLFYKQIQLMIFDRNYAYSLGVPVKAIDTLLFVLIALSVVVGIRSVGVVLMSAMLIAPSVSARQYTNKLHNMFMLSGFFGLISGFFGNYLSVQMNQYFSLKYVGERLIIPTGPMIVIVASLICLFSLSFSPERGLILRLIRIGKFRYRCVMENLLKAIWRYGQMKQEVSISFDTIAKYQALSPLYLKFLLYRLCRLGFLERDHSGDYRLTSIGFSKALKIIRLHRLWEVYLVNYLGVGTERVHRNAEEMEHIITPELESELTLLLKDPKQDPHHQPIPPKVLSP